MTQITTFDYAQLDATTADFLRTKEHNMREIVGKAYTELGRELKGARDKLAGSNQYDGIFRKWCASIGMKKDAVNRLIQRYELLVAICDDQQRQLLEDIPVSLSYEIAATSVVAHTIYLRLSRFVRSQDGISVNIVRDCHGSLLRLTSHSLVLSLCPHELRFVVA